MTVRVVDILGVPVHAYTMDEAVAAAAQAIDARQQLLFGVVNAAKIVSMGEDVALRDAVLKSDVILADGMSVVWASRLLRRGLPERVAGIDLMARLLEMANARRERVYCLGATDAVLATTVQRIHEQYPHVVIAGQRNGYFKDADEPAIADDIARSKATMLFVAMSSPKKELFLGRWAGRMGVAVCHGVGGSFDVMAGKVRRAPRLWQAFGMEWLYRVVQEPGRLWKRYLVTNTAFCAQVLAAMCGREPKWKASDAQAF